MLLFISNFTKYFVFSPLLRKHCRNAELRMAMRGEEKQRLGTDQSGALSPPSINSFNFTKTRTKQVSVTLTFLEELYSLLLKVARTARSKIVHENSTLI